MKIPPVEAELFHTDGHTARHDEANSRFLKFANAPTTAGSTWKDCKTNTETAKELNITTVFTKFRNTKISFNV
jgi:hypothetical protein